MKKNTIAFLIESELEKAEVVLAARSITDTIQKMAETVAKMEAEDVMPLNDPIREHFGPEAAAKFSEAVSGKLRELTQSLSETKNIISDEIARMQGEQVDTPSDDLSTMDDSALSPDANAAPDAATAPEAGAEEAPAAPAPEGGEEGVDDMNKLPGMDGAEPRYSDSDFGGNAAGRARKESYESKKPMLESADRALAREYVSFIREGKTAAEAAGLITETYGIDIDTLIQIMEGEREDYYARRKAQGLGPNDVSTKKEEIENLKKKKA